MRSQNGFIEHNDNGETISEVSIQPQNQNLLFRTFPFTLLADGKDFSTRHNLFSHLVELPC
jgi:hypothetical protein